MDKIAQTSHRSGYPLSIGQRLRQARLRLGWSQERLAEAIEVSTPSISRWERGLVLPHPSSRQQLCQVLGLDSTIFLAPEVQGQQAIGRSLLWNVPYPRNPYFIGREQTLEHLHAFFQTTQHATVTRIQAISGLAGIGKTQIALEYAYRFSHEYDAVFWLRAENPDTLIADLEQIAHLLDLPACHAREQQQVIEAVRHWLRAHSHWLLVLDNVENPALLEQVIASPCQGHLLLTTRSQMLSQLAHPLHLERLPEEEGALLVLRRSRLLSFQQFLEEAPAAQNHQAREISRLLGGLPLALDQAGAYLEETGCTLPDYVQRYETSSRQLLGRRGGQGKDHPQSVVETLNLICERLAQRHPAALELLTFCAFLHPESIAEEIISAGAPSLGSVLGPVAADLYELDEAFAVLRRFSLVQRQAETHTFSIHRLVQAVLKDQMDEAKIRQWMRWVILALNAAFPSDEFATWPQCERCVPHVQACRHLIKQEGSTLAEAAEVLLKAGAYLLKRSRYAEAEPLLTDALALQELQNLDLLERAVTLNHLGDLYMYQGRYPLAEPLWEQALATREQQLGPLHPLTAESLNNIAILYWNQGKHNQAEAFWERSLVIREQQLGPLHPLTMESLINVGFAYHRLGKYERAEPLLQRGLKAFEQVPDGDPVLRVASISNLGNLYRDWGKYEQAEPLLRRALAVCEQLLGSEHLWRVITLAGLGDLYLDWGKYEQAEPFLQQALAICERLVGSEHYMTAGCIEALALLSLKQGGYEQAELLFHRALAIFERSLGSKDRRCAGSLKHLGVLYREQGKYEAAEPLLRRALEIFEQGLGPEHPETAGAAKELTRLLQTQGR